MLILNATVLALFSWDVYVIDQVLSLICIKSGECVGERIVYNILQTIVHFVRTIAPTASVALVISVSFPPFLVAKYHCHGSILG